MLVDALPAGPARPRRLRLRGDRDRRRRGGVREDAPRRRAAQRRDLLVSAGLRVDHGVTSGTFSLDGADLRRRQQRLGGRRRRRAAWSSTRRTRVEGILEVVGDRRVSAIVCTHAHDDHVRVAAGAARGGDRADPAAPRRAAAVGADPSRLRSGTSTSSDGLSDRRSPASSLTVLHTPGHSPGIGLPATRPTSAASSPATRCSRAAPARPAGPTATADLIVDSIRARLFALPDETVVHTGHGDDTTIGAERVALG